MMMMIVHFHYTSLRSLFCFTFRSRSHLLSTGCLPPFNKAIKTEHHSVAPCISCAVFSRCHNYYNNFMVNQQRTYKTDGRTDADQCVTRLASRVAGCKTKEQSKTVLTSNDKIKSNELKTQTGTLCLILHVSKAMFPAT